MLIIYGFHFLYEEALHLMTKSFKFANIIIGCAMGFVMSWVIAYFVLPLPTTPMAHAINNGVSGLMSTLVGLLGLYAWAKQKYNI